jgi:hypothetical protein
VNVARKSFEQKLNDEYCTGIFNSTPGTIIDVASNSTGGYANILSFLQGRVTGLKVQTARNGDLVPLIRGHKVSIFLDESPVSAGFLNAVTVSDIAIVKVIKTPFAGSEYNTPAIAIYRIKVSEKEE